MFCIVYQQNNPKKGETLAAAFALSHGHQVGFGTLHWRTAVLTLGRYVLVCHGQRWLPLGLRLSAPFTQRVKRHHEKQGCRGNNNTADKKHMEVFPCSVHQDSCREKYVHMSVNKSTAHSSKHYISAGFNLLAMSIYIYMYTFKKLYTQKFKTHL